jgi:hypothetical protein
MRVKATALNVALYEQALKEREREKALADVASSVFD